MKRWRQWKRWLVLPVCICLLLACASCGKESGKADAVLGSGGTVLRIVSGSEMRSWNRFWRNLPNREHIQLEMTYLGSLDIMRLLGEEEIPYDAVWPASSLWLDVGT